MINIKNMKIAVLGGDTRALAAARALAEAGIETAVWGLFGCGSVFAAASLIGSAVRCNTPEDAAANADAVLLPLPLSGDNERVNCPLAGDDGPLTLKRAFSLAPHALYLAGKVSPQAAEIAKEAGVRLIDYFEDEALQIRNAVPTAEGAVAIAMRELPVTVAGSNMLVLGYGRVGRALTRTLRALGAHVTVAARKISDRAWAETMGARSVPFAEAFSEGSIYDAVFNTVPAAVIGRAELLALRPDVLVVDLAAPPGGTDADAVRETGRRAVWALSLPGKTSPVTAGIIIADTVKTILAKEAGV
jgi:dipicolinate synthase subunit A